MKLYLLRHAPAFERDPMKFPDDSKRPLTREGKKEMKKAALGMKALGLAFDQVLCSPYLRATETASIVAEMFKMKKKLFFWDLLKAENAAQKVIPDLKTKCQKISSLLLVGHEPQLSALLSLLLIGKAGFPVTLKKGGLACVKMAGPLTEKNTRLKWLLTPKQLGHCAA